jgi:hypothetical protein
MQTATQYAQALYELAEQKPAEAVAFLERLREILARRGHQRLLPRIYTEYEHLLQRKSRLELHRKVTPEQERTRQLVELYRRLIH